MDKLVCPCTFVYFRVLVCPCKNAYMKQQKRKTIRHFNDSGHAHFLTFSCFEQLPLLSRQRSRRWFIQAIKDAKEKYSFALLAYVIMPEHVHLVVFPLLPVYDIASFLKAIKQSVSRKAKYFLRDNNQEWLEKLTVERGDRRVFRFWQTGPGYDRNIHTEDELFEKIAYVHNNPVKRGLVSTPEEWKWSSAGWYKGERNVELSMDNINTARTNRVCNRSPQSSQRTQRNCLCIPTLEHGNEKII